MRTSYERASVSPRRAGPSKGPPTGSAGPSRPFRCAIIALIALYATSCRTARHAAAEVRGADSALALTQAAVKVTTGPHTGDSASLQLTPAMIQSLPQGAAWVASKGNTSLTATRTPSGIQITAAAPAPTTTTIETDTRAQAAAQSQTQAQARQKVPDDHSADKAVIIAAIALLFSAVAIVTGNTARINSKP